GGVVIA
nr:Chain A, amyloid-fibril forming peptide GGVVIA derived from the Alzheimer's amyloid Abeta [synthetic construct]